MKIDRGVLPIVLVFLLSGGFLIAYHGPHGWYDTVALSVMMFSAFFWNSLRKALWRRWMRKQGQPAIGRLLRTNQTGTRSGNSPLLALYFAVMGPTGQTWEASVRQFISPNQLYAMAPGTEFSVLYDPRDPQKIMLNPQSAASETPVTVSQVVSAFQNVSTASPPSFSAAGNDAATIQAYREMKATQEAVQQRLAVAGTLAKAKVLTCVPLPATINHKDPLMLLMLEIQPDYEPAFSGQVSGFIDSTRTDRYAPGSIIYVKYDPTDKSQIALVGSEKPI